jgi:hypothetical protein
MRQGRGLGLAKVLVYFFSYTYTYTGGGGGGVLSWRICKFICKKNPVPVNNLYTETI